MKNPGNKFSENKLLLLGTSADTCDMVNYAKDQGAYVIVSDNLPPEKSAAKLISDEAWMVSTDDTNTLEKLAYENQVNGITAGASEFNLEKALTLCERLRLPFYCNRIQWEICNNKQLFKQLCRDNNISVAREYNIENCDKHGKFERIKYPVIVKPVDSNAGIGIHICHNDEELHMAYKKAVSISITNSALVEEFITGEEFSAGYIIIDGQLNLVWVADKYLTKPGNSIPLPHATIMPSKYVDEYLEELNEKVIRMFQSIGLTNGFIFIQGTRNDQGFHLFETNYRLDGFSFNRSINKINGINYMEMLVNFAITGKMDFQKLKNTTPKYDKYCCCLFLISKGGTVGNITGLEEVRNLKNLISMDNLYDIGDHIDKSGTLKQIHLRFFLLGNTLHDLKNSIKSIQNTVKVIDDKRTNMLLSSFNSEGI